jgi:enoyl-CoA hydratase
MSPQTLRIDDGTPGLRIIELHRPERLNALSLTLVNELNAQLTSLVHDHSVRVVMLTGAGRAFCSGADISDEGFPDPSGVSKERHWTDIQRAYSDVILNLRRAPQPVIAAVNGLAVGGGFSICMASDIRLVARDAYFMAAQINIGQSVSEMGASYLLPRLIGGRAAELLMTGRRMLAEEADRLGFARLVDDRADVVSEARSVAGALLAKAPLALRLSKEALNASQAIPSLEAAVTMEDRTQTLCVLSEDLLEATAAFRERREAKLRG